MNINQDSIKELSKLGQELLNISNLGKNLNEDDIKNKPIEDVGFSITNFTDMANIGKKLNDISKLTSVLKSLGINQEMINKGIKLASKLIDISSKGEKSLKNNDKSSLSDIGLNMQMFNELSKAASAFNDIPDPKNIMNTLTGGDGKIDTEDVISGINNIFKKLR